MQAGAYVMTFKSQPLQKYETDVAILYCILYIL